MKFVGSLVLLLVSLFYFAPQSALAATTLVVGANKAQCPAAEFTTIQSAVNAAASGDTIKVCPGVYPEQVVIDNKSLTSLTIAGEDGAIVMPGSVAANGADATTGAPLAVIILVQSTQDVTIRGLIVDGSNNGITECSPVLMGILYENSSGTVAHNAVRSISTPSVSGCQGGDAIYVETSSGQSSTVDIHDNSVHDYQKNGITGNETGTTITIHQNTVTESAPASGAAPNGIQIGFGAGGKVTGNTVSGNVWSPCVSVSDCTAAGTGILIFESDGVVIDNNSVGTNQYGIFAQADNNQISGNSVFNSLVLDSIAVIGNDSQLTNNSITHSDQDAVALQGNDNTVTNNTIIDALVGILTVTGSTGNTLTNNTFYATVTSVADPASLPSVRPGPAR
jgi:nitrous oxidase accessory protein NosD